MSVIILQGGVRLVPHSTLFPEASGSSVGWVCVAFRRLPFVKFLRSLKRVFTEYVWYMVHSVELYCM